MGLPISYFDFLGLNASNYWIKECTHNSTYYKIPICYAELKGELLLEAQSHTLKNELFGQILRTSSACSPIYYRPSIAGSSSTRKRYRHCRDVIWNTPCWLSSNTSPR